MNLNAYNPTWPVYRAGTLPAIPDDQVNGLVQPILEHIRGVICSTDEEAEYFLAWLAQQVQHPAHKSGVGLVLIGDQGVGKSIIINWYIQYLLGTDVGLQTGNASHILRAHGGLSTVLQNKVLCVLDEADPAALERHVFEIKDLMTSPTLSFKPMNKEPYEMPNTVNIMITTHEKNPFLLMASDSRFVVFECNDSKKGDFAYFDSLDKNLNDRTVRAFYQFLLKFDLSDYGNFWAKRPETQTHRRHLKIPLLYNFLSRECINRAGGEPETCEKVVMLEKFKKWAGDANFEIGSYTATHFGNDFNSLMKKVESGVDKKRTAKGHAYTINWTKLGLCLQRHGLFIANV
jgi:hypothetical protein